MARAHSRARVERAHAALVRCAVWLWLGQLGCTEPRFRDAEKLDAEASRAEDGGGSDEADTLDATRPARPREDVPDARHNGLDAGTSQGGGGREAGQVTAPDAGSRQASDAATLLMSGDAGGSASAIPAWALPLVGTYAKRSVTFSYDDFVDTRNGEQPFNTRNVELSLVKIAQNGNQLDLSIQLCGYAVSVQNDSRAVVFKYASRTPPLKGRLVLGEPNHFTSAAEGAAAGTEMLSHLGFDPSSARTAMCTPGGRRPKFEDQKWITSSSYCQCYATALPEAIDDCRIVDSDGDGQPGIAANGPSVLTTVDFVMVFDYAVKIVDGEFSGDPQAAPIWKEARRQTQACFANDLCGVGNNLLCPGGTTLLLRRTAQTTCADFTAGDFGPLDGWLMDSERNCLMR